MKSEPNKTGLFKVFLLEDELALRVSLRDIIEDKLPGAVVVDAGSIEDGLKILDDVSDFVVGIVDVRVPAKPRMQPEAHPGVADRLRELQVPAIFITGYRRSDDVIEYLHNRSLIDAPAVVVEKSLKPKKMTSELTRHIRLLFEKDASGKVESCVNMLFGSSAYATGPRSGTAALITTQRTIVAYWPYLNEQSKQLVRQWFVVLEDGDAVNLSLLSKD